MMNKFEVKNMDLYYGSFHALKNVNLHPEKEITAFIGPSGCGKSTFLKRPQPHERPGAEGCRISGDILLDGEDIYNDKMDVNVLRSRVGMVFQKPNPFPMSIYDNIAYGPRTHGVRNKASWTRSWKILRGRHLGRGEGPPEKERAGPVRRPAAAPVHRPRLAVKPEVLLMDEPTSALDPIST